KNLRRFIPDIGTGGSEFEVKALRFWRPCGATTLFCGDPTAAGNEFATATIGLAGGGEEECCQQGNNQQNTGHAAIM
ncbi:MAG: hypothetical protein ACXW6T_27865, partial [Candidatus Binatia bacterium]